MKSLDKKVVLCHGIRTPVGHFSKSLASFSPEDLLTRTIQALLQKTKLDPAQVDGVIAGWVGQEAHAPNIARIVALKAGLPEQTIGVSLQCNCISSIESVAEAARHILSDEGELFIAGGTESMSNMPYPIEGHRSSKALRNLETLKKDWGHLLADTEVTIVDSIEEGLTDQVKKVNMAGTAEVCAQMLDITRGEQDGYAHENLKRCLEGQKSGFYATHVFPMEQDGKTVLEKDEYPELRKDLAEKPKMFSKAPLLFDNSQFSMRDFYKEYGRYISGKEYEEGKTKGTLTLFNSCPRSDGAAAVLVTTEEKAKTLGLEILAEIASWGFYGIDPAHMGLSPAYSTHLALQRANLKFSDINLIELHEAFAATCLGIFKVGKDKFGHDWRLKWENKELNPHGGSIAIGHPLGATGTRLLLNLLYAFRKFPQSRYGLIAACASGGMGGTMILKKYN